jgi:hypothetical protein
MKIHEKARLYDELMKDVQSFVSELETYRQKIENIETADLELVETKQNRFDNYHSMLAGKLKGSNFGLGIRIDIFKGTLSWYNKQK